MKKKKYYQSRDGSTAEWLKIRKKVLQRDGHRCQRCNIKSADGKGLTVHHITPRSESGGTNFDNLITLCHSCHDYVETAEDLRNRANIMGSWEG